MDLMAVVELPLARFSRAAGRAVRHRSHFRTNTGNNSAGFRGVPNRPADTAGHG
jgi:hypothetical protein